MFDWLMQNKVEEIIPEALREPLKRQNRDQQIAEQLRIPPAIERIEEQLKELAPKEEAAKSKRVQIERMIIDLQSKLTAAKADEQSLHWQAADLRGQIEDLNCRKARYGSTLLTQFAREMLRKWDVLRNAGRDEEREGRKKLLTGKTTRSIWTNRPSVERAIAYVRAAMAEAEKMMREPLTDAEIKARLDVLRQDIPPIGEWVEIHVKPTVFTEAVVPRYGERPGPSYF